jgi:hypothetical protein
VPAAFAEHPAAGAADRIDLVPHRPVAGLHVPLEAERVPQLVECGTGQLVGF